ncbi:hypothetical protein MLD38_033126 [Melastoma candidum]|uniref:Uncharacterized protein n=1 Tax=Melastoma candidum TaxID=119954 RepID=A0ACB9M5W4_9MYRT|nr:hypothetical protein MLD38_033126 [Melastoma candidum]
MAFSPDQHQHQHEHEHLNGAYYGPSIPPMDMSRPRPRPRSRSFHRPGRGGGPGSCLCCCCECIGCCIFQLILQVLLSLLFFLALLAFLFWLIFRPNLVKFHVTGASLTRFNLSSDNLLDYGLGLNLTVRNPNTRIGIYYDSIEARTSYEGQRFYSLYLPPFYQGHKNTTTLDGVFQGQQAVSLDGRARDAYETDKASGSYGIDLKVYLRVRFKVGWFKTFGFKPRVSCGLKVPLTSAGGGGGSNSGATFETTKCRIGYWWIF